MEHFDIAIIGGGGTGAAVAYDLSQRGFRVVLFEKGELTSGTTGRHHGQLHSGARYALGDVNIARECMAETLILRRIAMDCLEFNQGLFLAIGDEDESFTQEFVDACRAADIPAEEISRERAFALEGKINPKTRRIVQVPDGTIDAYRLVMSFFASAKKYGAGIRNFSEVTAVDTVQGKVSSLTVKDTIHKTDYTVGVSAVVNAGGPWGEKIAALGGISMRVTPAAGTMVAVEGRLTNMVVSRLRRPGDGDIIVPQRRLSIIGTTQRKVDNPDGLLPPEEDVELLLKMADEMIPGFSSHPVRARWCAARPLAGCSDDDGRSISRDFAVLDHGRQVKGFFSVAGGKATTLRIMGEKVADAVSSYFGETTVCKTADEKLESYRSYWDA